MKNLATRYRSGAVRPSAEASTGRLPSPNAKTPQVAGGGTPYDDVRAAEIAAATKKEREKIRAGLEENPLSGEPAKKYNAFVNVYDKGESIAKRFRPEFVGKGMQQDGKAQLDKALKFADELGLKVESGALTSEEAQAEMGRSFGALSGRVEEFFGTLSPEEAAFRREVLSLADDILRARSGAQINEKEYARIVTFLPGLYTEPATFVPRLASFQEEIGRNISNILEQETTGAAALQEKWKGRSSPEAQQPAQKPKGSPPPRAPNSMKAGSWTDDPTPGQRWKTDGRKWIPVF